jgi:hypothetical protein
MHREEKETIQTIFSENLQGKGHLEVLVIYESKKYMI